MCLIPFMRLIPCKTFTRQTFPEIVPVQGDSSKIIQIRAKQTNASGPSTKFSPFKKWAAHISSCVMVLSRKHQSLNNVWTALTACGALTQSTVWHHGNHSLQLYFKQTLSVTLFLQCTLPDTNRVPVCVCACNLLLSLLASCAHSCSDLKSRLLTCPLPFGGPQSPSIRTVNKLCCSAVKMYFACVSHIKLSRSWKMAWVNAKYSLLQFVRWPVCFIQMWQIWKKRKIRTK